MHLTVLEGRRRVHIYSRHGQAYRSAALPDQSPGWIRLRDAGDARRFLDRYFHGAFERARLHACVLSDACEWAPVTAEEMLRKAVARLATGAWVVRYEEVAARASGAQAGAGAGLSAARAGPTRVDPAGPMPAEAADWPTTASQLAQAIALERAAAAAMPFCELCALAGSGGAEHA